MIRLTNDVGCNIRPPFERFRVFGIKREDKLCINNSNAVQYSHRIDKKIIYLAFKIRKLALQCWYRHHNQYYFPGIAFKLLTKYLNVLILFLTINIITVMKIVQICIYFGCCKRRIFPKKVCAYIKANQNIFFLVYFNLFVQLVYTVIVSTECS